MVKEGPRGAHGQCKLTYFCSFFSFLFFFIALPVCQLLGEHGKCPSIILVEQYYLTLLVTGPLFFSRGLSFSSQPTLPSAPGQVTQAKPVRTCQSLGNSDQLFLGVSVQNGPMRASPQLVWQENPVRMAAQK